MRHRSFYNLIEQVFMLLVFGLTAAVCFSLFAWASALSDGTRKRDEAYAIGQYVVETIQSQDGDDRAAKACASLGLSQERPGLYTGYYAGDGLFPGTCDGEKDYTVLVTLWPGDKYLGKSNVVVLDGLTGEELCRIRTAWQEGRA